MFRAVFRQLLFDFPVIGYEYWFWMEKNATASKGGKLFEMSGFHNDKGTATLMKSLLFAKMILVRQGR